ncbi:MAG: hypothetical protein M1531_05920 [Chloroflexi bacterium]|nr:hypothetical protein [Chloroflexota bacterium]
MLSQSKGARRLGQGRGAYQRHPHFREAPFLGLREVAVQMLGDHEPEHRIAKEFQPLVGRQLEAGTLIQIRAVHEGLAQQTLIVEANAEAFL